MLPFRGDVLGAHWGGEAMLSPLSSLWPNASTLEREREVKRIMKAAHSVGAFNRGWVRIALRSIGLCVLAARCYAAGGVECNIGAYLLSDGSIVDIAPSDDDALRWRRLDGTTGALHKTVTGMWTSTSGWTDRGDGESVSFSECDKRSIEFDGVRGERIDFNVRETMFHSRGTALAGRLVMPLGRSKVPVVVLVHGSEQDSALETFFLQRLLPAYGVGAFVYDKRGTGHSAGTYSQDFNLLADDAVAAMREARRLAGSRLTRIGYQGGSQGGWVAPIAANRARVDFVIVCYGLAVSVIDEDQQEVEIEMREKGYSPAEITQALEVARAAEAVVASHFTKGFAELDAMRAKYRSAPWYKDLHGNYTYMLLPYSETQLRELGSTKLSFTRSTPFHYDPMPTLRADMVPQLWVLGGEDYEAPSAETSGRIKSLIESGLPFTLACYPHAEHGMTLFEIQADGTRVSTRYAPGYFAMIRDFARFGQLPGTYGDAEISRSRLRSVPAVGTSSHRGGNY
jgi:dienelactone hydrolase